MSSSRLGGGSPSYPGRGELRLPRAAVGLPKLRSAWRCVLAGLRSDKLVAVYSAPLFIGLTVALWLAHPGYYLFGQDSSPLSLPFAVSHNPLVQYNYLLTATFPVPDETPYFLFDCFLQAVHQLGAGIVLTQRLAVFLLVCTSGCGIVYLSRVVSTVVGHASRAPVFWEAILATSLYVMNPLTLSIVWWHIEGWTFFYAFSPFLVALLLEFSLIESPRISSAIGVLAVGLFLAPGTVGSYTVALGYCVILFTGVILLRWYFKSAGGHSTARRLSIIWSAFLGLELWFLIPYVSIPKFAFSSSTYITYDTLISSFISQSAWSTLPNVFSMVGTGWLYTSGDSAFAWIAYLPLQAALAFALTGVAFLGLVQRGRARSVSGILLSGSLVLAVWAAGANEPLTAFKFYLVSLHGPFLALVEGYDVAEPLYVVFLMGSVLVVLASIRDALSRTIAVPGPRNNLSLWRRGVPADSKRWNLRSIRIRARDKEHLWSTAVVGGLIIVAAGFASPFVLGQVYQSSGLNSGALALPPSFQELASYFSNGYSAPAYYTLMLPLSHGSALPLKIGDSQLLDTSGLIAQFIPYPLIWINNSQLSAALDQLFAESSVHYYPILLSNLHIRYIVFNPYAEQSDSLLADSGSGEPINWSAVNVTLSEEFSHANVGAFTVYSNPRAIPLAFASPVLIGAPATNLTGFLSLLAEIRTAPSPASTMLEDALWEPTALGENRGNVTYQAASFQRTSYSIPLGSTPYLLSGNGSLVALSSAPAYGISGVTYNATTGQLETRAFDSCDLYAFTCNVSSNFKLVNGTFTNQMGETSTATFSPLYQSSGILVSNVTIQSLDSRNWLSLAFVAGGVTVLTQVYGTSAGSSFTLGLVAYNSTGVPYAWNNTEFSLNASSPQLSIIMDFSSSKVESQVVMPSGPLLSAPDFLFYQPGQIDLNSGRDRVAAPSTNVSVSPHSAYFQTVDMGMQLNSLKELSSDNVTAIYSIPNYAGNFTMGAERIAFQINGDLELEVSSDKPNSTIFVALGYPSNPLWVGSSSQCNSRTIEGAPLDNVYLFSSCNSLNGAVRISLTFNVAIDEGLYVAIVEFSVASLFILVPPTTRLVKHAFRTRRRSV